MTSLRVCLLTPAFPPAIGGQESHAYELAAGLIAQGVTVRVITKRLGHEYLPRETLGAVPVIRLSPVGELKALGWRGVVPITLFLGNVAWRLLREARSYDVILVSGFNLLPLVAALVCAVTRKPCVVRPESPLEMQAAIGSESLAKMGLTQNSLLLKCVATARQILARRIDRYVAISAQIEQALVVSGIDPGKIVVIPNGINVETFAPAGLSQRRQLRVSLGLPIDRQILIYTGRLAISKGVMMLVDIWRELSLEDPDAHLVLLGTGVGSHDDCEAELRQFIATHELSHSVSLPGNVADVQRYLQAADAFVFPSDSEGFALSILEAMAVGLPMVSTRVGVVSDIADADELALIVPPADRSAFLSALRRVLADPPLRQRMGQRARLAVHGQYSMNAVARRYIALFCDLTGRTQDIPSSASSNPASGQ